MSKRKVMQAVLLDGLSLAGVVAVGYGLWLIYAPAAWLWLGVVLLVVGIGLGRREN